MKYTINTKPLTVTVKSNEELVSIMRSTSIFFSGQNNKQFMEGFAARAQFVNGTKIDATSIDSFVRTCVAAKFITKHS